MSPPPLSVLLVEDDPNDVLFLKRSVRKLGLSWTIDVASDGDEAVRKLSGPGAPDHVLLDLKIPRRSGFEVLKEAHRKGIRPRVIILTSSNEQPDRERAAPFDVEAYFLKPARLSDFDGVVERIARIWA